MEQRELTRQERVAIRSLVERWCANSDRDYGCLPLGCECYMLGKCWTGAYCRYFRESVLPLAPELEAAILSQGANIKPCPVCGRAIPVRGRKRYCSAKCRQTALRIQKRNYMRKSRGYGVEN